MTNFPSSYCHKTLPQGTGRGHEWKNVKICEKFGSWTTFLMDGLLKVFFKPQYVENGQSDFCEIFRNWGLTWPSLRFRAEVNGGSNFEDSGAQSCKKWQVGLWVGHFGRVAVKLYDRYL